MAVSYASIDLPADGSWTDLVASQGGIASAAGTTVQNIGWTQILVYFGGGSAPSSAKAGHILPPGGAYYDKNGSANIWAKGPGTVSLSKD